MDGKSLAVCLVLSILAAILIQDSAAVPGMYSLP